MHAYSEERQKHHTHTQTTQFSNFVQISEKWFESKSFTSASEFEFNKQRAQRQNSEQFI
jgi:hypothetical protein